MAALPVLKLAGLLVKQIAKPLAARMKIESAKHPKGRLAELCVSTGQAAHQLGSRLNVLASGYSFIGVKPLPRDDALSKGINFWSETVVFICAGTIITIEYQRGEKKNQEKAQLAAAKEAKQQQELQDRFQEVNNLIKELKERIDDMEEVLDPKTLAKIQKKRKEKNIKTTALLSSSQTLSSASMNLIQSSSKVDENNKPDTSNSSWRSYLASPVSAIPTLSASLWNYWPKNNGSASQPQESSTQSNVITSPSPSNSKSDAVSTESMDTSPIVPKENAKPK